MIRAAELPVAWRIARRELRGGLKGFLTFLICLAVGVAAVAAVGLINASVVATIEKDARALLGGDVVLDNVNLPIPPESLRELIPAGAPTVTTARTNAMVTSPNGRHVAVSLKAVDDAWPLAGEAVLEPPVPLATALADNGAVAEAALFTRLGVRVGDELELGALKVRLRAVIVREPDKLGGFLSIGPRLLVSDDTLRASGVLQPGALVRWSYGFVLPDGTDIPAFVRKLRRDHPDASWRARGKGEVQPQVSRFTDRLASYLTMAGLTALLIGGLGVALAVQGYLAGKTATIATLKCLGAKSRLIFAIYFMQVLVLAAAGVVLGLGLGWALPHLLLLLPAGLLPVRLDLGLHMSPLLLASAAGLLTAFVFTLWPLAQAREVSPASLFRAVVAPVRRLPRLSVLAGLAIGLLAFAAVAILGTARPFLGAMFVLVAAVSAGLLGLLAQGVLRLLHRLGRRGPLALRMAMSNLQRPGSGAASVVVAMGAGLAVLTMVALLQHNLAAEIATRTVDRPAATVFIDIQPSQWERFQELVASEPGAEIVQAAPMLRARVVRIAGRPVDEVDIAENVRWTIRQDRALSWQREAPPGTVLSAGAWWPADYAGPPLVSVEDEVAIGYGVGIGDTLAFNVLGRVIEARIANLRRDIDWTSGRLDFIFILSPGVIDKAPHTMLTAVETSGGTPSEARLIDAVAGELPNVTPVAIGDVVAQVSEVLERLGLAVRVVAGVTLLTGVLVLAGAVIAARRRQRYQTIILKVLGARRAGIVRLLVSEYLALGSAAACLGVVLGTIGAWIVVRWVIDLPWSLAAGSVAAVVLLSLAVTVGVGSLAVWRHLRHPPAALLRET